MAKFEWAYPGARVVCINDEPENGLGLSIKRGGRYTLTRVRENGFIYTDNPFSVSLAEIKDDRNEFWLARFEPLDSRVSG